MMAGTGCFVARIRFLSREEGGRASPAFQGYRPMLLFDGDETYRDLSVSFLDEDGGALQSGSSVPVEVTASFRKSKSTRLAATVEVSTASQPGQPAMAAASSPR
jgi:translation elongation factor EF-Tu-like GTPase